MNAPAYQAPTRSAPARAVLLAALAFCIGAQPRLAARTLEQIVSREPETFDCATVPFTIGQDGFVYLCSGGPAATVLRMLPDGSQRSAVRLPAATATVTANRHGVVALAAHPPSPALTLANARFEPLSTVPAFSPVSAAIPAPAAAVEVGAGGDFYVLDPAASRILRYRPDGAKVREFPLRNLPADDNIIEEFRVSESKELFCLRTRGSALASVGFDGSNRWIRTFLLDGREDLPCRAFDLDENGILHVLEYRSASVKQFGLAGETVGLVSLHVGPRQPLPGKTGFFALRVTRNDILIRSEHPTVLFQRYDRATGEWRDSATIAHERLAVDFPSDTWTAGGRIPFTVQFESTPSALRPSWRVWIRPLEAPGSRPLPWDGSAVRVPDGLAGLYRVKVTPEIADNDHGVPSEYQVQAVVEIRAPAAEGSVSVFTPENRVYYGRGEMVPFSALLRAPASCRETNAVLRLVSDAGIFGERVVSLTNGIAHRGLLPAALTAALRPGAYDLAAVAPAFTCIPQRLVLGPGLSGKRARAIQYADRGLLHPTELGAVWTAPDRLRASARRFDRLGVDFLVERLGIPQVNLEFIWDPSVSSELLRELNRRLQADPLAVAPDKILLPPPLLQDMGVLSAQGVRKTAILLGNDASLPPGSGPDPRSLEQLNLAMQGVTRRLQPYPSFRGWNWAGNWRVAADAQPSRPPEAAALTEALRDARETGAWDSLIDEAAQRRFGLAPDLQAALGDFLRAVDTNSLLTTSMAAPIGHPAVYPPSAFTNVDEIDLQSRWLPMAQPFQIPFAVDFYRRPAQPVWIHPELSNDDGTGAFFLRTAFLGLMRGADRVGFAGSLPSGSGNPAMPDDPRFGHYGLPSVIRAFNRILREVGPLLSLLARSDDVAIPVSRRMLSLDLLGGADTPYAPRLFEAYLSCLFAHRPASFVFAEDLPPAGLASFKAILIVGQTVEFEPAIATAITQATNAGIAVLADDSCRPDAVRGLPSLGIAFDTLARDPAPAADDDAFRRFTTCAASNAAVLSVALGDGVPPVLETLDRQVLASRRVSGSGSYFFVVDHRLPDLDPSQLWRLNLFASSRRPGGHSIRWPGAPGAAVYDVFAMKRLAPRDGLLDADFRSLPARLYAVLPDPVHSVELGAPPELNEGQTFTWTVRVRNERGQSIPAAVPVRIRFFDSDRSLLDEVFAACDRAPVAGRLTVPLGAVGPDRAVAPLILEATELLEGRTARLMLPCRTARLMLPCRTLERPPLGEEPIAASESGAEPRMAVGADVSQQADPVHNAFGARLRDLSALGVTLVASSLDGALNLTGLDADTGRVLWQRRLADGAGGRAIATRRHVAVPGVDLATPEGYHLYLAALDGSVSRRFALNGLPGRLPHPFMPALPLDPEPGFAVPAHARWVAGAGSFGLTAWNAAGRALWTAAPGSGPRRPPLLAALGDDILVAADPESLAAYAAPNGRKLWSVPVSPSGTLHALRTSADGITCAVATSDHGGELVWIRRGRILRRDRGPCTDFAIDAAGKTLAAVSGNRVLVYSAVDGLSWTFPGDDRLSAPRFSPDGRRLAVGSDLGTLYVFGTEGTVLLERDMGARPTPAWLPDGALAVGTWMGRITRLNHAFVEQWNRVLQPGPETQGAAATPVAASTTRAAGWVNAETAPWLTASNLLDRIPIMMHLVGPADKLLPGVNTAALHDGRFDPPPAPAFPWTTVGMSAGSQPCRLQMDTMNSLLELDAITLAEDPAHPESWLRHSVLEYWDIENETWVLAHTLLSDSAVHTHRLPKPVRAARFRLTFHPAGLANPRLAEVRLHGSVLGYSHPDVAAGRSVAVLFDEQQDLRTALMQGDTGLSFQSVGAAAGARYLRLEADRLAAPAFQSPFGRVIPNWSFQIAADPAAGQYRYLTFAWKALSPETRGITLALGGSGADAAFHAGLFSPPPGWPATAVKRADQPPRDWTVERVDLWALYNRPAQINMLWLGARGGPAAFDAIRLGRTEKDLAQSAP